MKTLIICIPPELFGAGEVKSFLRWLSVQIRGFWRPSCPACGSERVWRDGVERRRTAPPVQRFECPSCGRKFCDRTGTPFWGKHSPSFRVFSAFALFLVGLSFRAASRSLGVSHATVVRWCAGLELVDAPVEAEPTWIADETFVRVAGKAMYEVKVVDRRGRTLSRVLSPRRTEREAEMVLSEAGRRYGKPGALVHDGNRIYHRALENRNLVWKEGVVIHRRGFVAEDGSTTNPLECRWSHFRCWNLVHRGFKKWANAQHYYEQYSRARNHPEKTLPQLLIPDK